VFSYPYQAVKGGYIARQGIIPGGIPLHLSSLLQIVRHQYTIRRIEQLLADLGELLDGPEAID